MFSFKKLIFVGTLLIAILHVSLYGTIRLIYIDNTERRYTLNKKVFSLKDIPDCDKENIVFVDKFGPIITKIAEECFKDCVNLTNVVIPNSITEIGKCCFWGCKKITTISIPASVKKIGCACFHKCKKIESITIPKKLWDEIRGDNDQEKRLFLGLKDSVKIKTFSVCIRYIDKEEYYIVDYIVEKNIFSLEDIPNKDKKNIVSVEISGNVISAIKEFCFVNCKKLTTVIISSSVTVIGNGCFSWCEYLETVDLPNSIRDIECYCFNDCKNLKNIAIPPSVQKIGYACFNGCENLTTLDLPDSIKEIGYGCFIGCKSLTSITISKSLTKISIYFFCYCEKLTSIDIPDSIVEIGKGCFTGCEQLTAITIPNSVEKIGKYCFSYCENLKTITIPQELWDKIPGDTLPDKLSYLGLEYGVSIWYETLESTYVFHIIW